jgi:VWFA-related protein
VSLPTANCQLLTAILIAMKHRIHVRWTAGLLCMIALAGTGAHSLSSRQKQETGSLKFSVQSQLVEVYLTVARGKQLIPHLKSANFQVTEDDLPVLIDHLDSQEVPLQIVLLFDASESIRDSLTDIQDAASAFVKSLNPEDRVILVLFNSEIRTYSQTTDDREPVLKEIKNTRAHGMTRLYEAMLTGMKSLDGKPGRKAIVCFTDGQDTSSTTSRSAVMNAAARFGYPIYAIGTGAGLELTSLQIILTEFAEINGGRAFFIDDHRRLRETFAKIGAEMRSAYVLNYYTKVPPDGRWHAIDIHSANPDYSIRARKGFYARDRQEKQEYRSQ